MGKKVLNQCASLKSAGLDVQLLVVRDGEIDDSKFKFIKILSVQEMDAPYMINIVHRVRRQFELRQLFSNIIASSSSSLIVYTRYPYPLFYLLWPFSRKSRKCKIINEHNTIEHEEFKLTRSPLISLIDLLFGDLIRNRADGIVGVTKEITSYEIGRSKDPHKPHITIGNGIDVKNIVVRNPPNFAGYELRLICVASFSPWHGLDRLLRGIAIYKGRLKIYLYIVGSNNSELQKLRTIVNELMIEDHVIFTGFMSGLALDDLFNISHLGIGTLGLHRQGMKEASSLKAREYCARGIPFLCDCSDPDFPDDFYYIQKVPADESPINIEEVARFAGEIYLDPQHHMKMRAFAEKELDWSIKMIRLKEFCETLVED